MNRGQKILQNTIVYTIGNFGSKILSYIMVLVYTNYITAADLGYYDVIITTVSLLQPIVLLMFDDGVYRWLIDDNQKNKEQILSTCIKTVVVTTSIASLILIFLNMKLHLKFIIGIIVFFSTSLIYSILLNSVRGLSNSKLYASSGILNSFLLLIFELIGIIFLQMGVEALFISKALANIITILFLFWKQKELRGLVLAPYNQNLAREIARYSLPLIPNNISWWIVNFSDRYIIMFFLGTAANGIYSIANKFPTIVTTVTGILYFSFQETMLKEYYAADRDIFYSNIFKKYYEILFSLVICGIPTTRIMIELFTGSDYTTAWMYSGFLYLSTVYSALSALLGIGYQISRETNRSVYSTVGAAGVNIFINIIFIKIIGLHAASLSTLVAYIFLLIIRIKHSKKYFSLHISWKSFYLFNVISLLVLLLTFVSTNLLQTIIIILFSILSIFILNIETIKLVISRIKNKITI